jgi:ribosomal protein L17
MKETTIEILKSVLKTDPTITAEERSNLILLFKGAPLCKKSDDKLLKRKQVAEMLSSSTRLVDKLAVQGLLHKVTFRGRQRSAGYRRSEVEALLAEGSSPVSQPDAEITHEAV